MGKRENIEITRAMKDAGAEIIDDALSSPSGVYPPCLAEDVFLAMVRAGQQSPDASSQAAAPAKQLDH
jgi:hypothetical protein